MNVDKMNTSLATTRDGRMAVQVEAQYGMSYLAGNSAPYYSITGEVRRLTTRGKPYKGERGMVSSGRVDDLIRKAFGKRSAVARSLRWALCDQEGVPMHYTANALYWVDILTGKLAPSRYQPQDAVAIFGRHIVHGLVYEDATNREEIECIMRYPRDEIAGYLEARKEDLKAAFDADMRELGVTYITPAEMGIARASLRR